MSEDIHESYSIVDLLATMKRNDEPFNKGTRLQFEILDKVNVHASTEATGYLACLNGRPLHVKVKELMEAESRKTLKARALRQLVGQAPDAVPESEWFTANLKKQASNAFRITRRHG